MTVSHPGRLEILVTPVSEPQILHVLKFHIFAHHLSKICLYNSHGLTLYQLQRCCEQNNNNKKKQ
jgi:hypothetical protein